MDIKTRIDGLTEAEAKAALFKILDVLQFVTKKDTIVVVRCGLERH